MSETIQSTTNYRQFKFLKGNRPVNTFHVNKLVSSIAEKNLLADNPIIVNEKLEVIDGQHRLEAARKAKLPIYFTVVSSAGLREIQLLNSTTKNWVLEDFCNSYMELGLQDYRILKDFSEASGFKLSLSLALVAGGKNGFGTGNRQTVMDAFKRGDFKIDDKNMAWSLEIAREINRLRPFMEGDLYRDREFIGALVRVLETVTIDQLVDKLKDRDVMLEREANVKNYLRQFEDIMNFRVREERHVRLY